MGPSIGKLPTTRRWVDQRWLVDSVIRSVGIEWDQPRIAYTLGPCGPTATADFNGVRARTKRFVDIAREFERAGRRRETVAAALEAEGRHISASESYFIAALLYGSAQWGIFETNAKNLELDERKTHCYVQYSRHADHEIRRVEIPFSGGVIPAYFHLPANSGAGPVPAVLGISGMDTFKEMRHSLYGDRLLNRGFAGLAIDGPGQGEALVSRGIALTESNFAEVGQAAVNWLRAQPEVDSARIAVSGASFGSFWATQIAGAVSGLMGTAVAFVCHEPGFHSLLDNASPTFKLRLMYMSGYTDEDEFDQWSPSLDLRSIIGDIDAPYMAIAGELDELSPIEWSHELFSQLQVPKELNVYESETHGLFTTTSTSLGPNPQDLLADWLSDRANGQVLESTVGFVDLGGRLTRSSM